MEENWKSIDLSVSLADASFLSFHFNEETQSIQTVLSLWSEPRP